MYFKTMSDVISAHNLQKIYKLYGRNLDRVKEAFHPLKKKYHTEFHALKDISFKVRSGERVGIIGKNGSGKSTLLKILTGVVTPSRGQYDVQGKISALLELGAGFNPELNGIENIFLSGLLMGHDRSTIKKNLDYIIDFAEIGQFIQQPVRMYSSGMYARLAFATAINVSPQLLIIDEALSVGDQTFQAKCFKHMNNLINNTGLSVLIVSHSLPQIRNFSDRVIWLKNGEMAMDADPKSVCEAYSSFCDSENVRVISNEYFAKSSKTPDNAFFESFRLDKDTYTMDDDILIKIAIANATSNEHYSVGILVYNSRNELVTLYNSTRDRVPVSSDHREIELKIPKNDFVAGVYSVTAILSDTKSLFSFDRIEGIVNFKVNVPTNDFGLPLAEGFFRSKHEWLLY